MLKPDVFAVGAGFVKEPRHVEMLAASPELTHIIGGSYTLERRPDPGEGSLVILPDGTGANCRQLPNGGLDYLERFLAEMVKIAHDAGKAFILSIAAVDLKTVREIIRVAAPYVDGFEINFGCSHIFDDDLRKQAVGYNPKVVRTTVADVLLSSTLCEHHELWLKLPSYGDEHTALREQVANVLLEFRTAYQKVRRVTAVSSNSLWGFRPTDEQGAPLLSVGDGTGSMSGTGLYPYAVKDQRYFIGRFEGAPIKIIACGGIDSFDKVQKALEWGCIGVQTLTSLYHAQFDRSHLSQLHNGEPVVA